MKMPWGKYKGIDIAFINSRSLRWYLEQDWFIMKQPEDLILAVEKELEKRDKAHSHFYENKVKV